MKAHETIWSTFYRRTLIYNGAIVARSKKQGWIDISAAIRPDMVIWPGDPPLHIKRALSLDAHDMCNLTTISMCVHAGTHMDAPRHFLPQGPAMETWPFDATGGAARVIAFRDRRAVQADELRAHRIRRGERILIKTPGCDERWRRGTFDEEFVYISARAAEYLVERGARCVGVDYLSVGGFRNDLAETHKILLGGGIWIIEGLNLSRVRPGRYDLMCLPLLIPGSDGAPARAMLRPR